MDTLIKYLVVDDDDTFRERLVQALQRKGFEALGVSGVERAVCVLQESKFHRMILDLKMPEKSGLELLEYLFETQADMDVVVLTGYGSIATTLAALKLGAVSYLTKPVSLQQILSAFEESNPNGSPLREPPIVTPSLSQVEWEHIQRVMRDCDGNVTQAAKMLGLHRRSLQRKLQKQP